jgi:hypothetical protein
MMTFYIIGAMYGCVLGWVVYEFWRAPLMNESGQIIKKQKKSSGSYKDLEKLGRGRSKY